MADTLRHWERLGLGRRAGVAVPLFSIHSKKSSGVGEFRDLGLLADWCRSTGHSLIQLLPLNDVGNDFRPYDAQSAIALEPMHLSVDAVQHVPLTEFSQEIALLRETAPTEPFYFDTRIKGEKLSLLLLLFKKRKGGDADFGRFREEQKFWLEDYALFKVIKEKMAFASWETWPQELKDRDPEALKKIGDENEEALDFHAWLQWQCFLQFSGASRAVKKKGVLLMGDLPFLVSRDSADVWSHPHYFKLGFSAGAPPDLYFAGGQEWGMPPYDWQAIEAAGYDYWKARLRYAENFYHLYRIDHFVGLFRLWTLPREGIERHGAFDPPEEHLWESHGEKIVSMMLEATAMLPCAEDLGTVPDCSSRVLAKLNIPGMEVQRWTRDWKGSGDFLPPERYRANAMVTLSTHDSTPFALWWEKEASLEEKEKFLRMLGQRPDAPLPRLAQAALEAADRSCAVFSVQLLQDLLLLGGSSEAMGTEFRINRPGIVDPKNWRLRLPFKLEEMKELPFNGVLTGIHRAAGRS